MFKAIYHIVSVKSITELPKIVTVVSKNVLFRSFFFLISPVIHNKQRIMSQNFKVADMNDLTKLMLTEVIDRARGLKNSLEKRSALLVFRIFSKVSTVVFWFDTLMVSDRQIQFVLLFSKLNIE